jgi:hypothetical protein
MVATEETRRIGRVEWQAFAQATRQIRVGDEGPPEGDQVCPATGVGWNSFWVIWDARLQVGNQLAN